MSDSNRLVEDCEPLERAGLYVLAPVDMILHSATHLFFDGEFDHGLRDLVDFERLIWHFRTREGFWDELLAHARHHELSRPLYYALKQAERLLACPVPSDVLRQARRDHDGSPVIRRAMDTVFTRAIHPVHPTCAGKANELARGFLYLRGHYLRMPPSLLLPHLVRKSFRSAGPEASG